MTAGPTRSQKTRNPHTIYSEPSREQIPRLTRVHDIRHHHGVECSIDIVERGEQGRSYEPSGGACRIDHSNDLNITFDRANDCDLSQIRTARERDTQETSLARVGKQFQAVRLGLPEKAE
jgi:hypothetical protein